MSFENSVPTPEKEPHWLTFEEIVGKMNNFVDTHKCPPPRVEKRPDGLVTLVEYEVKNEDGSISIFSYMLKGPRTANTVINLAHFRGNPDDGDWLGGETLADYDEAASQWRDGL